MRLSNFDLNLLVALDVLMTERSVTRAAARLNVTQSAMSASLKRLRQAFDDELLILHGKTMIPTPRALALAPEVADAIARLRGLISMTGGFDPLTSERRFRVAASDYITTVVIVPLLQQLERDAPHVRLDITLPKDNTSDRLANGDFDLSITPIEFTDPRHPTELLLEESHVVVGWNRNPLLDQPLTLDAFMNAGHVAVHIDGRNAFIENTLEQLGLTRRVEVNAPSFIQAPWLLPGTMRLALMHERLALLIGPSLSLRVAEPPFAIPKMREVMQYHSTRAKDEALAWLRCRLRRIAAVMPSMRDVADGASGLATAETDEQGDNR
ncbi:LysR family transcriptional regulator [Sphingomonas sp. ASY06-1R]|uniref:LysR family transcriptional regulator n=1 Tax=Sphingomonas sp. ASY06-1R TaxID=3445771 RepID=UPI003FA2153E